MTLLPDILEQIEILPTPERLNKENMKLSPRHFKSLDVPPLVLLYHTGKLGPYPDSLDRLRAGLMLMKDYFYSEFTQRMTFNYDGMARIRGTAGTDDVWNSRQEASERYMNALDAVGKYRIYALHFLRDEKNVRRFILENPVLNSGDIATYRSVYKGLRDMLDLLVRFYAKKAGQKHGPGKER